MATTAPPSSSGVAAMDISQQQQQQMQQQQPAPSAAAAAALAQQMSLNSGMGSGATVPSPLAIKKQNLDDDLKLVEQKIMDLEDKYIEATYQYGNIIKGWDGFMTAKPPKSASARKPRITMKDRVFSSCSLTSPAFEQEYEDLDDVPTYPKPMREKRKTTTYAEESDNDEDEEYEP